MRRAYAAEQPRHFELRDVDEPPPGPGEVQLRVRACGISDSDRDCYREPGRWMPGRCLGHEVSGEILAVGEGIDRLRVGERVCVEPLLTCGECEYCRGGDSQLCPRRQLIGLDLPGGFAELLTIPAAAVHRLPEGVGYALGTLAEPLARVVHGMRLAASTVGGGAAGGDRVVVLGGGALGLLAAFYARQSGAREVCVTTAHEPQAELARQLGASRVFNTDLEGTADLAEWAAAHPVDLVVDTAGGRGDTLAQAIALVRPGGRVCVLGALAGPLTLDGEPLRAKEVRLVGSLAYGRRGGHADFDVTLELLRRFGDVLGNLITHHVRLDDLARGFALAADESSGAVKVVAEP